MPALHFENLRGRAVTRDPEEEHRASTPLELFFDLTFVVAVGRVADAYQHELAIGEIGARRSSMAARCSSAFGGRG